MKLEHPDVIYENVDMEKDTSIWRLVQQGLTLEVSKLVLYQMDINLNNIWRKVEREKGAEASLGMW